MIYIQRDAEGSVVKAEPTPFPTMTETLEAVTPEIKAFMSYQHIEHGLTQLRESDQEMIRVLEDLIHTLIHKGLLSITDLPDAAQAKLLGRSKVREAIGGAGLLIAEELEDEQLI